jgi:hypothetical protein
VAACKPNEPTGSKKKKKLNRRATPLSASEGGFCAIKVLKCCFWWNKAFPEVAGLNVSGHTLLGSNNPRVQKSKLLTGQQSGTEIGNMEHPHCPELITNISHMKGNLNTGVSKNG